MSDPEAGSDPSSLVGLLPHRHPMLQLDAAERHDDGSLTATQRVPDRGAIVDSHFPGFSVWPGVLLLEAMAQGTALHLLAERGTLGDDEMPVLGAADVRFLQPVFPGERIEYRVELVRRVGDLGLYSCRALRDGQVVARAKISAGITPRQTVAAGDDDRRDGQHSDEEPTSDEPPPDGATP